MTGGVKVIGGRVINLAAIVGILCTSTHLRHQVDQFKNILKCESICLRFGFLCQTFSKFSCRSSINLE